jgi:CheY-like chemotaxis protein
MSNRKTILYVDDDADDREMFGWALDDCDFGFQLATAQDGLDALDQLAREEAPLCIYIDVNMPKMNGLEFLKIIKSHHEYANIPAFILSTSINPDSAREARRLGAAEVFVKPVTMKGLRDQLNFCFATHIRTESKYAFA